MQQKKLSLYARYVFYFLVLLTISSIFTFTLKDKNIGDIRKNAQVQSSSSVRGIAGDMWSDIVLGKIDFNQSGPNQTAPFKVFIPGGAILDRTVRPNRLYVYDSGNSRVLGYSSLGTCANDVSIVCTADSDCGTSSCTYITNKHADIVIGQPSF